MTTSTGLMEKPKKSTTAPKASKRTKDESRRRTSKNWQKKLASKELSMRGDEAAARFLQRRGYEILERNWECFAGEVDIIARDEGTLVFVEVKTRRHAPSSKRGFPSAAITDAKMERFEKIALAFLGEHDYVDIPVRFDIVSIMALGEDKAMIKHLINVFSGR